jgi:hypothetical protein
VFSDLSLGTKTKPSFETSELLAMVPARVIAPVGMDN